MNRNKNLQYVILTQDKFSLASTNPDIDYDQLHDDILGDNGLGDIHSYTPIIDGVNPITGDLFIRYEGQRQQAFPMNEVDIAFEQGWYGDDREVPVSDEAWLTMLDIAQAGTDVTDHISERVGEQFAVELAKRAGFPNPTSMQAVPITVRADGSILFRFWGTCTVPITGNE